MRDFFTIKEHDYSSVSNIISDTEDYIISYTL